MSSYCQYEITITDFTGNTPCNGYYVYTGLTTNINGANYINGINGLIPIVNGYTFIIVLLCSISKIYLFIEHCDGHVNSVPDSIPKFQGGYQLSTIDLRCDDCYEQCDSCDFVIDVSQGGYIFPSPIPQPTPSFTPSPSFTPTPSVSFGLSTTPTPTPTPTPSQQIPSGVNTVFMTFNAS